MTEQPKIVSLRLKGATIYACHGLESLIGNVSRGDERWGHISNGGSAYMLFDEYEWPYFYALVQAMNEGMMAQQESGK